MMGNQKSLRKLQKSLNDIFNSDTPKNAIDPCPVCDSELHYGEELSKRCGLLNSYDEIVGWLCPYCKSEFDEDDNIVELFTSMPFKGKA
jgi:hypothetical protein